MSLASEIAIISLPYLAGLGLVFTVPHLLALGLWKLGVRNKDESFKEFRKALGLILNSALMIFVIVRILLVSTR